MSKIMLTETHMHLYNKVGEKLTWYESYVWLETQMQSIRDREMSFKFTIRLHKYTLSY